MRSPNQKTFPLFLVAAALAVSPLACIEPVDGIDTTDDAAVGLAVNEQYGALTADDEAPDFDDADLADEDLATEGEPSTCDGYVCGETDDPADVDDPDDAALPCDGPDCDSPLIQPRRLLVSIVWGHLRPNPTDVVTDWSGSISVENAALKIKRLIKFDQNDSIVRPRESAQVVEYVSHTKPHLDGLLLEVVMHPALGTTPETPAIITVDNPQFYGSLTLTADTTASGLQPTGDGNAIAYHIFHPDLDDGCKNGVLGGRYTKVGETDDGRNYGKFKGRYVSAGGTVVGKVKGVWGQRENGKQVLFGKVINNEGEFKGIIAGRYRDGQFKGRYINKDHEVKGAFHGFYRSAPEQERGMFRARWSERCGEAPNEGEVETSDDANEMIEEALAEAQMEANE